MRCGSGCDGGRGSGLQTQGAFEEQVCGSYSFCVWWWLKCCFTSTETVGLLGTGAQDVHLDFHTAPELCCDASVWFCFKLSAVIMKIVKSAGSERIKTTINLNQKWSESLVPHSCVHTACGMNEPLILGTAFVVLGGGEPRQTETNFRMGFLPWRERTLSHAVSCVHIPNLQNMVSK